VKDEIVAVMWRCDLWNLAIVRQVRRSRMKPRDPLKYVRVRDRNHDRCDMDWPRLTPAARALSVDAGVRVQNLVV
jgi:hypothetical protein